MKTTHAVKFTRALVVLLGVVASALAGAAAAASDCIHVAVSDTNALCVGHRSTLRVDVENTCLAPARFALRFAMDQKPLRAKAADVVPGGSTLLKQVLLPVPVTMSPGRHSLTVTSIDASGQISSTDANVTVDSCRNL